MIRYSHMELCQLISNPASRELLLDQWPRVGCHRCNTRATCVAAVEWVEEMSGDNWVEIRALCATCCLSDYGRGIKSDRPTIPFRYMPKRKRVDIIATITNKRWHQHSSTWS